MSIRTEMVPRRYIACDSCKNNEKDNSNWAYYRCVICGKHVCAECIRNGKNMDRGYCEDGALCLSCAKDYRFTASCSNHGVGVVYRKTGEAVRAPFL